MQKKTFQDIVPPQARKKTVRASSSRVVHAVTEAAESASPPRAPHDTRVQQEPLRDTVSVPRHTSDVREDKVPFWNAYRASHNTRVPAMRKETKRFSVYAYIAGALGVVALVFLVLSFLSRGATVTVHPRTASAFIDSTFIISQTETPGMLSFVPVEKKHTVQKEVEATGVARVEERATGIIRIQNTFSTASQRLIKNTRFASPEGLVFRIPESVEVPGMTRGADGTDIPGVIETRVVADETGEKYNIGPTTFTIPGFSGTPRFQKITASSASPMSGGFAGNRSIIASSTRSETEGMLRAELREALQKQAEELNMSNAERILVYDLEHIVFDPVTERPSDSKNAILELTGTLGIAELSEYAFAEYIAAKTLASYDNLPVSLVDKDALAISFVPLEDNKKTQLPWQGDTVQLKISGTAQFEWRFDEKQFLADLVNKEEGALPAILRNYPGIKRAEIASRPFWSTTLPEDAERISLKKKLDFEGDTR